MVTLGHVQLTTKLVNNKLAMLWRHRVGANFTTKVYKFTLAMLPLNCSNKTKRTLKKKNTIRIRKDPCLRIQITIPRTPRKHIQTNHKKTLSNSFNKNFTFDIQSVWIFTLRQNACKGTFILASLYFIYTLQVI